MNAHLVTDKNSHIFKLLWVNLSGNENCFAIIDSAIL